MSIFDKAIEEVEAFFTTEEAVVIKAIRPSWDALVAYVKTHGVADLEQLGLAMGTAAIGAISGGASVAGQAALAAGALIVKEDAPDVLHALSTAAVTGAKATLTGAKATLTGAPADAADGLTAAEGAA